MNPSLRIRWKLYLSGVPLEDLPRVVKDRDLAAWKWTTVRYMAEALVRRISQLEWAVKNGKSAQEVQKLRVEVDHMTMKMVGRMGQLQ